MISPKFDYSFINTTFYDIGARGCFPEPWQLSSLKTKVIRFDEPSAEYLELPVQNIAVESIPKLLTDQSKKGEFFQLVRNSGSSLLPLNEDYDRFWCQNYHKLKSIESVNLYSLKDLNNLPAPHLIKLDTQGTELDILNGLDHSAWSNLLGLEIEVSFLEIYKQQALITDVLEYLSVRGYELIGFRPSYCSVKDYASSKPSYLNYLDSRLIC